VGMAARKRELIEHAKDMRSMPAEDFLTCGK
jgi:hypothetical protein